MQVIKKRNTLPKRVSLRVTHCTIKPSVITPLLQHENISSHKKGFRPSSAGLHRVSRGYSFDSAKEKIMHGA